MIEEIRRVFFFYFFLGKKSGRARTFWLLSSAAVLMALVIRAYRLAGHWTEDGQVVFQNFLMVFFLQFLIVLLGLFYGSSIVVEELDNRTLPYLTSRPLRRAAMVAGKYLAYLGLTTVMLVSAVWLSYLVLNLDADFQLKYLATVARYSVILWLGLAAYLAFFSFLGTWLKKPILVGLAFGFGWESVIQYFPGTTQKLSVAHYLKSLLPQYTSSSGQLGFLFIRLEPTKPWLAILVLVAIALVFLALACLIFSYKEYLYEE
ncbi:MAG: ABC transporter permease [Candidatus Saccharicenans sp.]|jgi:ABC-type transport system involved in multi-copper enzyme maturation permease subunit|nr:ABC transporter permease [Candidatus Saccharicenans sp.]